MSEASSGSGPPVSHPPSPQLENPGDGNQLLFWGCFIALVTTAFGFITRMFLATEFRDAFGLDAAQTGRLIGMGIWPFAVSIIGFSLVIDKIGYKVAMLIAFAGHIIWAVMALAAYNFTEGGDPQTGYQLIYWGSLILALANGTVEAFINPVVATIFTREKTKWLNILHAGWPGGLVIAGVITIFIAEMPWGYKLAIIALPAVVYFFMLIGCKFPVQERVASGVSYREMLSEFGILGATVVGILVSLQLMDFFSKVPALAVDNNPELGLSLGAKALFWGIGLAIVVAFGLYTRALGRPIMFVLVLIMMPLATTELGTDSWITGIMEGVVADKFDPGWVLVYTSAIMMVLRFFAGPIVHTLSPLGLLAVSALLAIVGLLTLSMAGAATIIITATLYGLGKTFFWPTMLGVVAEQSPKGGALTLSAIAGIGMLTAGTLGTTYIGVLQSDKEIPAVAASEAAQAVPRLVENDKLTVLTDKSIYGVLDYTTIDNDKLNKLLSEELPPDQEELNKKIQERKDEGKPVKEDEIILSGEQAEAAKKIKAVRDKSSQGALANMAIFPAIMLVGYLCLMLYFRARGGYQAEVLTGHAAEDEKFTGGIEGAME